MLSLATRGPGYGKHVSDGVASRTVRATTVTRVSITEDAPAQAPPEHAPPRTRRAGGLVVARRGLRCWCSSPSPRRSRSGGRRRARRARRRYRVLGDLAGIRLDLGDADVEIDGGATAVEVRRVDRFAFGEPSDERRSIDGGTLQHRLALPGPGARLLPRVLPADRARQRPARDRDLERLGAPVAACARRSRSTPARARSPPPASAASSLRASSDSGDVSAVARVLGRPARAALAQRRRARGRPVRALPDRRAERLGHDAASAGSPTSTTRRSRSRR